MAGFSFTDEKEAGQFYKKVEQRDKYTKGKGAKAPPATAATRSVAGNHGMGRGNMPTSRSVSTLRYGCSFWYRS